MTTPRSSVVPDRQRRAVRPHVPMRPLWLCRVCAAAWPCPPARLLLGMEYRRDPVALSVHMAGCLFDATADLITLNPNPAPSPAELFDRFLAWTASTRSRRAPISANVLAAGDRYSAEVATRPLDREELTSTAPERDMLEGFLEAYREVITGKLRGLSEPDARRRLVPSATTLIGLVRHAAAVERNWFQHCLAQQPRERIEGDSLGDDASWRVGPDDTLAGVVAEYEAACDRSRQIAARLDLDDTMPHPRLGRVSLRYVYLHMIRELARHCGHADILREQIDGSTGD